MLGAIVSGRVKWWLAAQIIEFRTKLAEGVWIKNTRWKALKRLISSSLFSRVHKFTKTGVDTGHPESPKPSRSQLIKICMPIYRKIRQITERFTKLLTNGFRSSFQIPEVHHELGNFITQLSIKLRTWERRDEFHVTVGRFASYELLLMCVGNWNA